MKYRHICIEGNISAGKTSLATKLAKELGRSLALEQITANRFLPEFYDDPSRISLLAEISFLQERFTQMIHTIDHTSDKTPLLITDYHLYKSLIFSKVTLSSTDHKAIVSLYETISPLLPAPDLIVYLTIPIHRIIENINQRGRSYEQNIQKKYLEKIEEGYMDYFDMQKQCKVLMIDGGDVDFINVPKNFKKIVALLENDYSPGNNQVVL